ncbi:MAG: universal stress protein [Chitinophagaceae bacterium]|nr:universal stress protein [Chitinophagaceae bacterium]
MQKLFNRILVPVDFSRRSAKAVEKAVDLANEYDCSITLLHVISINPYMAMAVSNGHLSIPYIAIENRSELQFKLDKIISNTSSSMKRPDIRSEIVLGSWDECVISYVLNNRIDLVLIGQKSVFPGKRRMFLNPDRIAMRTQMPVMTAPVNKKLVKLLSVLIPVTDFLPVRKLMYGIYMARLNNATIKLLSVRTKKSEELSDFYLKKSYRLINDNCDAQIEMECIESNNTAVGVSQYLSRNQADLMILNPGTQTRMPGVWSSLFGRVIQKYIQAPVLTITPL